MADNHSALNAYLASVERRALRMAEIATRDRDEAMDIVQEAMFKLVRKYVDRPEDEWPPLFFRILERKILDWHRATTLRRKLFGWVDRRGVDDDDGNAGVADPPAGVTASAEQDAIADHAIARLKSVLEDLPLRQQQVFLLRVWEGLTVRDTARAMGCSDGTVKTHLSRALAHLRAELGEVWP